MPFVKNINNKILNIDQLFSLDIGYVLISIFTFIFGYFLLSILWNINRKEIKSRSPFLMVIIITCSYMNSVFNTIIVTKHYDQIAAKCQLAMMSRLIWHSGVLIFIITRIRRVHHANLLEQKLFEISSSKGKTNCSQTRSLRLNLIK